MRHNTTAEADGATTATEPEAAQPLQLHCKVLVNGMLYAEAHHAAGKLMLIPKDKAEYLAGMNPPQVEIQGVG
jgi:hypothetical protein